MSSFGVMRLGGGAEPVLLWENPNPNTSFTGTTITNYSKSQYPYVIVESRFSTSDSTYVTTIFDTSKSNPTDNGYLFGNRGTTGFSYVREIAVNDDNLVIGDKGFRIWPQDGNTSYAIPLRVWGF